MASSKASWSTIEDFNDFFVSEISSLPTIELLELIFLKYTIDLKLGGQSQQHSGILALWALLNVQKQVSRVT